MKKNIPFDVVTFISPPFFELSNQQLCVIPKFGLAIKFAIIWADWPTVILLRMCFVEQIKHICITGVQVSLALFKFVFMGLPSPLFGWILDTHPMLNFFFFLYFKSAV